jgi:hypothetical protein
MSHKTLAAVLASAVMVAAFSVRPADAAKREKPLYRSDTPPSLDGRTTGWPRTSGHDFFVYSTTGTTVGPYCH